MSFEKALEEFGIAIGNLKKAYAEEFCANPSYISIEVDSDNYVSIIPTLETGKHIECFRDWVSIED